MGKITLCLTPAIPAKIELFQQISMVCGAVNKGDMRCHIEQAAALKLALYLDHHIADITQ